EPPAAAGHTLTLLTNQTKSLESGSPVLYRGIQVGEVLKTRLAGDSRSIEVTVRIDSEYAPLVRKNSKFWRAGGINLHMGLLSGIDVKGSFKTLIGGGIAFSSPDPAGPEAPSGTIFRLYDQPEDAWTHWAPLIKLNEQAELKK